METRHGTAIVWMALMFVVIIFFVGISLDWGKAGLNVHELHVSADAAALAGAQTVKFDQNQARDLACAIGQANSAERKPVVLDRNDENAEDGEIVIGRWIRQYREFIPTTEAPNAVLVVSRREGQRPNAPPITLVWGPIFNTETVNVSRHAIAMSVGSVGAGLLTLLEDPNEGPGIQAGGGDQITVNDGDVQDNSQSLGNPRQGFRGWGTFDMECAELNVCGDIYPAIESGYWNQYEYNVNANTEVPLPDPLIHTENEIPVKDLWADWVQGPRPPVIAPPPPDTAYPPAVPMEVHPYGMYGMAIDVDAAGNPVLDAAGNYINKGLNVSKADPIRGSTITTYGELVNGVETLTLVPGYYPGGIELSENKTIKMLPGIYALGGGNSQGDKSGLIVNGGTLDAQGVMLYITASTQAAGSHWGKVELTGGNVIIHESYDLDHSEAEPYPNYIGSNYKYIAIFQDRANQSEVKIAGNGIFDIAGTVYFPTAHMKFTGCNFDSGTQLIAGSIETTGGTTLTINYDGRFFVKGYRSILVE